MVDIDFQNELNEEQYAAVSAPPGPVLVIAAAGTGKTRALTYRVAWLVHRGEDPQRILLLTFTNRAAREMLERARGLVGDRVSGLWGGTFHHMANRILRRHAGALGYGVDYTILDQDDSRKLVRSCTQDLGLSDRHFPKPDVLLSLFGLSSGRGEELEILAQERFERAPVDVEDVLRVAKAYTDRKRDLNAMDFDDLLANGLRLFREHPDILSRYQERFRHVLVDEYQDTNHIQAEWVDLVAGQHRNLLVVGDDFQSIYSWRGADFRNIIGFPRRYPDARMYKLETNYRSVPGILNVANACIAGNPEQFQKTLRAVREDGPRPSLLPLPNATAQSQFIVQRIHELAAQGVPLNRMAVLYRSHFHAMELQLEFTREGLPYRITSGVRFFEQAHIKDVCSILRIVAYPSDELAFCRLLEMLPRVGNRTALKIWRMLGNEFDASDARARQALREAIPAAARDQWAPVDAVLAKGYSPKDEAPPLIEDYLDAFYEVYALETFDNHARRLDDVQELIRYSGGYGTLEEFLNEMALITNLDTATDDEADEADAVRLSTVHQAKGLEWDVVFILWCSDTMFPSARSLEDAGAEQEERRLFYVASTRARDQLYYCMPASRRARDGSIVRYMPSRFITELPSDLLEVLGVGYG